MNNVEKAKPDESEIMCLRQENDQLKSDIKKLQKQFNDVINSYPKTEELIKENVTLKKNLNDSKIQIDDLNNRLSLTIKSQNESKQRYENNEAENANRLNSQIKKLKTKIVDMRNSQKLQNEEDEKKYKKYEENILQIEKQNKLFQNQLSKVLALTSNFFKLQFEDIDSLLSFFIQSPNQKDPNENELQNNVKMETTPMQLEDCKINKYKNKYEKEKCKVKQMEQKVDELTQIVNSKSQQYQNSIDNLNKEHQNEIKELQANHQKEIQHLKNQSEISEMKLKRINNKLNLAQQQLDNIKQNQLENTASKNKNDKEDTDISLISENSNNMKQDDEINLHMKDQVDNLVDQLRLSEEKILDLREKQKEKTVKIEKLQKTIKILKRQNDKLSTELLEMRNNEKESKSQTQNEAKFDLQKGGNSSKIQNNEMESLQQALDLMKQLVDNRQHDIQNLTENRQKLTSIIFLQDQYIQKTEGVIDRLVQKSNSQEKILKNLSFRLTENDTHSSSNDPIKQIDWQFDKFPQDITALLRPIAENDCLSINSRIRHVMLVITKWLTSINNQLQEEKSKNENQQNELIKKYDNFISDILSAFGEKDDLTENEIIGKINELSSSNLLLQQKLNQAENKKEQKSCPQNTTENDLNQYLIEIKKRLKRKKIELRESKHLLSEFQEKFQNDISTLQNVNSKLKSENDDLRNQNQNLKKQYEGITDQMSEMKKEFDAEMDDAQIELEKLQNLNSTQIQSIQKESRENLEKKDTQIRNLRKQLDDATKTIENYEESTRATIEDMNSTKHQLVECKHKNKEKVSLLIKQKEKEKSEMEKYYLAEINNLQNKINEFSQSYPNAQSLQKIKEAEMMIEELEGQVIKLTYQIQQDSIKNQSEIDTMERNNKLIVVQNKAKLMALEASYSIKCDELKKQFEDEKKQLLNIIVHNFQDYFDLRKELDENAVKEAISKIKNYLMVQQKKEVAIRNLISAKDGQSTEDALTDFLLTMNDTI